MSGNNAIPSQPTIPWVDLGESSEPDDSVIRGNREGLMLLRTAIDDALSQGRGQLGQDAVLFREVQLCEMTLPTEGGVSNDRWLVVGCLLVFLSALVIFFFGLADIARRVL